MDIDAFLRVRVSIRYMIAKKGKTKEDFPLSRIRGMYQHFKKYNEAKKTK